jgi:hypothetical protein
VASFVDYGDYCLQSQYCSCSCVKRYHSNFAFTSYGAASVVLFMQKLTSEPFSANLLSPETLATVQIPSIADFSIFGFPCSFSY